MRQRFRSGGFLVALCVIIACGDPDGASGGREGDGMASAGAGSNTYLEGLRVPAGGWIRRSTFEPASGGECELGSGCTGAGGAGICTALSNGYRVCVPEARLASAPSSNSAVDDCDPARPCAIGACYEGLRFPSGQCGLGGADQRNVCLADSCQTDEECSGGICGPSGLTSDEFVSGGGVRQCLRADCREDADCALAPGGVCALVESSCGNVVAGRGFRASQMACVYPGGCLRDSHCGRGSCSVVDGAAVCLEPLG